MHEFVDRLLAKLKFNQKQLEWHATEKSFAQFEKYLTKW